jgi:hypothetical protein
VISQALAYDLESHYTDISDVGCMGPLCLNVFGSFARRWLSVLFTSLLAVESLLLLLVVRCFLGCFQQTVAKLLFVVIVAHGGLPRATLCFVFAQYVQCYSFLTVDISYLSGSVFCHQCHQVAVY